MFGDLASLACKGSLSLKFIGSKIFDFNFILSITSLLRDLKFDLNFTESLISQYPLFLNTLFDWGQKNWS